MKKNLDRCQIFTPKEKVNKLLNIINYKKDLYGKKFLENSCGNGAVLKEVVFRYINDCLKKNFSLDKIRQGLENDIWAFEIDKSKYSECIDNLNNVAKTYGITNIRWNIILRDYLKYNISQKFSFIAGNPPYRNYRDLSDDDRIFVKNNFNS